MSALMWDVGEGAEANFGGCDWGGRSSDAAGGDGGTAEGGAARRQPDGSPPDQAEDGADLKAMSRLFDFARP